MLVEVVLAVPCQYWRTSADLAALPGCGATLRLLVDPELRATVIESAQDLIGGGERTATTAILVRAQHLTPPQLAALRRAGWRRLL